MVKTIGDLTDEGLLSFVPFRIAQFWASVG